MHQVTISLYKHLTYACILITTTNTCIRLKKPQYKLLNLRSWKKKHPLCLPVSWRALDYPVNQDTVSHIRKRWVSQPQLSNDPKGTHRKHLVLDQTLRNATLTGHRSLHLPLRQRQHYNTNVPLLRLILMKPSAWERWEKMCELHERLQVF